MFHCEKNIAFSLKKAGGVGEGGVLKVLFSRLAYNNHCIF